jgi:hypothetical protein
VTVPRRAPEPEPAWRALRGRCHRGRGSDGWRRNGRRGDGRRGDGRRRRSRRLRQSVAVPHDRGAHQGGAKPAQKRQSHPHTRNSRPMRSTLTVAGGSDQCDMRAGHFRHPPNNGRTWWVSWRPAGPDRAWSISKAGRRIFDAASRPPMTAARPRKPAKNGSLERRRQRRANEPADHNRGDGGPNVAVGAYRVVVYTYTRLNTHYRAAIYTCTNTELWQQPRYTYKHGVLNLK